AAGWHGHMDGRTRPVEQAVPFGRGVVAEHGVRPGAQQGAPQLRLACRASGKCRVDAALKPLPVPVPQPVLTRHTVYARAGGLPGRDDARLVIGQIPATWRKFERHGARMRVRHEPGKYELEPVDTQPEMSGPCEQPLAINPAAGYPSRPRSRTCPAH